MKSLHVLREGLHVSVSQIKGYLRCPRQYELRYVLGVEPRFVPVALAFGAAIHSALAVYYLGVEAAKTPSPAELIDSFEREWRKWTSGKIPLQSEEDDDSDHVAKGAAMLTAFHRQASAADAVDVAAVELPFEIELHDPSTGELLEEKLVGAFDLLIRENGGCVIVEHKTSGRKYGSDQLRFDLQLSAYSLAAKQLGFSETKLRFQILTKTKLPSIQLEDVQRSRQDELDFVNTTVGVLRAIEVRAFYPVRGWQCKSCAVAYACISSRNAVTP